MRWLCRRPKAPFGGVPREAPLVDLMEIFNRDKAKQASRPGGPYTSFRFTTLVNSYIFDTGKTGLNRALATPFCYTFWSQNGQ